jgi:hypothetical protein
MWNKKGEEGRKHLLKSVRRHPSCCVVLFFSICLSHCLAVLSVWLTQLYLSVCIYLFICLSLSVSVCLSVCLSVRLSVCLSLFLLSVCLSVHLCMYVWMYIFCLPDCVCQCCLALLWLNRLCVLNILNRRKQSMMLSKQMSLSLKAPRFGFLLLGCRACPSLCLCVCAVCLSICLPVCLCLSLYLSVGRSVGQFVGRSVGQSVCLSAVCLSVRLSVCLSVSLSVTLSINLSVSFLFVCLSVHMPACLSVCLCLCLDVCLFVIISLSPVVCAAKLKHLQNGSSDEDEEAIVSFIVSLTTSWGCLHTFLLGCVCEPFWRRRRGGRGALTTQGWCTVVHVGSVSSASICLLQDVVGSGCLMYSSHHLVCIHLSPSVPLSPAATPRTLCPATPITLMWMK